MPVASGRPMLLADAAIRLIADSGIRALTHRAVDAAAGLPAGTASYHFRTRRDLLRAILTRIAEIDAARIVALSARPAESVPEPATREQRIDEARLLADRLGVFIDGQLAEHRSLTVARLACQIEVASDPDLREILHTGAIFRTLATAAVARLGAVSPARQADGLIALLEGLQYDRLIGTGSLTAATAGTPQSREQITAVVSTHLFGLVPSKEK